MWFKRLSLAALAAASSQLALASPSSVLQFEGAVKGTTCSISVGGVEAPNPATVMLEPVNVVFLNIFGDEYGADFDIDLKNCAGAATKVSAIFQGANGTTVTDLGDGNYVLDNMATSDPAKYVWLGLSMETEPWQWHAVAIGSDSPASHHWIDIGKKKLRLNARYWSHYSRLKDATPGNFETAMQFTVVYQ